MSFRKMKLNNESGFSLVELMVVVAIIGILAAMSVGQIGKQVAKARQSEVKSNLAALYTAMKTFQGEFGAYYGEFKSIGFGVEGQVRYDVGFSAAGAKPAAYTTANAAAMSFALNTFCTGLGTGGVGAPCTLVNTNGTGPQAPTGAAVLDATGTSFTAEGAAAIFNTTQDVWRINQIKALTNSTAGIP